MRILIVEDEKHLANALVKLLEGQQYAVEAVYDGKTGLEYAQSGHYDALVLDVMLPGLNGFQIASTLRQEGSDIPILMLTARDKVMDKVQGLDSGADDYLTKPFTTEELLARVRALLRRQGTVQLDEVTFGDIVLSTNTSTLSCKDKQVRLSRKELDVMHILMSLPSGHIISKEDLIIKVWGADSEAVDNNVEAYISFLRKKLFYLDSKVQIVVQRRLGYLLEYEVC
ncbi:MAG: response regulator transcription factor [Christensenellales bacterium]|jgi:DNA-binding response OmpR family regulator|nr:response regulator transcription factor [Clostridiales bacterium]